MNMKMKRTPLTLCGFIIVRHASGFAGVPRSGRPTTLDTGASGRVSGKRLRSPRASPLDDFFGSIFGRADAERGGGGGDGADDAAASPAGADGDAADETSLSAFQAEVRQRQAGSAAQDDDEEEEFDGYALRDVICAKYGHCFDVEFQRVDSYGFRTVYLNIMPFRLGKRPFRHATELDYLCHLQAVVEILVKYEQLDYVLVQLGETTKKPRAGTSPLIAVPLRLDLSPDQVEKILG